jgi:antitoxin component YwqK of YwqJK toxin-antitoxin module
MQKLLYLIALSILTVNLSFGQTTQGEDSVLNYTDISGNKQGKWIKYYDDDNQYIRYSGFFINNEPQGVFKHYHPNGKIKAVQEFNDDGSSIIEMHWENGNIGARGSYNADKERHGKWIFYYAGGERQKETTYNNGIIEGLETAYYKNGQKLTEIYYENGVKQGEYTFYFDNGNVREKGVYENDQKHGKFEVYYPDGSLDEKGFYRDDRKEGDWLVSNQDGKFDTVEYRAGVRTDRDSLENEFWEKVEWAKENQQKFQNPEDYLDNPFEYFRRP